MDYQQIGYKIRQSRTDRNLTQEEFAEEIAMSVAYVGQIERGQRKASVKTLEKIAERLDMPLTILICDLTDDEQINCIWKEKGETLTHEEKRKMLTVFEMILDLLNTHTKK